MQPAGYSSDMKATQRLKACESLAFEVSYLTSDSVCKEWHCRPFFSCRTCSLFGSFMGQPKSFPEVEEFLLHLNSCQGKENIEFPSTFRKNAPKSVTYKTRSFLRRRPSLRFWLCEGICDANRELFLGGFSEGFWEAAGSSECVCRSLTFEGTF